MKTIKANNYKQFTLFNYESKKTTHKYDLGSVVFKESEITDGNNPIGIVIQLHHDGDYRTEMYGNVSENEIRPATWAEIFKHAPDLMEKVNMPKKRIQYESHTLVIGESMELYMNAEQPIFVTRVIAPNGGYIPVKIERGDTLKSIGHKAIKSLNMFRQRGADVSFEITKPLKSVYDEN